VITGFNTDVEYAGLVYHVQTEDKGLDSPIILSLVYSGGEILASKRTPYDDLITAGEYTEAALAQRLKRQHKLVCAAIHAGRIEDLKRLGSREADTTEEMTEAVSTGELETTVPIQEPEVIAALPFEAVPPIEVPTEPSKSDAEAYTIHDARRQSPLGELAGFEEGLQLHLLDEQDFHSGQSVTLRVAVTYCSAGRRKAVGAATVSVKVLGTSFQPAIYTVKTERDGTAVVSTEIPKFSSGRAAILVRAVADGSAVELRRVIHPDE
jgi:hypothetical protein